MNSDLSFQSGLRETLPTVFGYIGIGLAFGILGRAAGLPLIVICLLSLIVFAGSAQFIIVSMMAAGNPVLPIIISVFLVNSRMILMAVTTSRFFKRESLGKNILIGSFLTDESFALGMNKLNYTENRLSFGWFNAANLLSYASWNFASLVGGLLGALIPNPTRFGLGFAMTAMFIGLLYLQIIADRSLPRNLQLLVVVLTLVLVYFGLVFIPASLVVLVVTVISCGLGVLIKNAYFKL